MAFDLDDEELEATRRLHGVSKNSIQNGEYIRTDKGTIAYISNMKEEIELNSTESIYMNWITEVWLEKEKVSNHSKRLKDLVEKGDIIRYDINTSIETLHCVNEVDDNLLDGLRTNNDFKLISIVVTKEKIKEIEIEAEEN